jgi:pimeloyl-ACP methyl ester carboxylesterase
VDPLKLKQPSKHNAAHDDDYLIHGVHVESKQKSTQSQQQPTPLVLLHSYMNGSSYFYRNLVGLRGYFQSVCSLDMLGWGMYSRPKFDLIDDSVETAEDFFVQSLDGHLFVVNFSSRANI